MCNIFIHNFRVEDFCLLQMLFLSFVSNETSMKIIPCVSLKYFKPLTIKIQITKPGLQWLKISQLSRTLVNAYKHSIGFNFVNIGLSGSMAASGALSRILVFPKLSNLFFLYLISADDTSVERLMNVVYIYFRF